MSLAKDGIGLFSYLAVLLGGTRTFFLDRVLPDSINLNIFLCSGCFKICLAKFVAICCLGNDEEVKRPSLAQTDRICTSNLILRIETFSQFIFLLF